MRIIYRSKLGTIIGQRIDKTAIDAISGVIVLPDSQNLAIITAGGYTAYSRGA